MNEPKPREPDTRNEPVTPGVGGPRTNKKPCPACGRRLRTQKIAWHLVDECPAWRVDDDDDEFGTEGRP